MTPLTGCNVVVDTPTVGTAPPWDAAVLVTRHESRTQWNMEALKKHCARSMKMKQTGKLKEHVEIVLGMRAMVMLNISTEGDLANGTREEIVDMKLDAREELPLKEDEATGTLLLKYPPTMLYFKPDKSLFPSLWMNPSIHGLLLSLPMKSPSRSPGAV
ncbi:hypothetical protein DFH09DRAFT_1082157 [Mycena vulgaris]|nr:hypothetical protein DFH09DRAFT_1082157 [Mycena vulgaris]